jgi:hypothetical protein
MSIGTSLKEYLSIDTTWDPLRFRLTVPLTWQGHHDCGKVAMTVTEPWDGCEDRHSGDMTVGALSWLLQSCHDCGKDTMTKGVLPWLCESSYDCDKVAMAVTRLPWLWQCDNTAMNVVRLPRLWHSTRSVIELPGMWQDCHHLGKSAKTVPSL